jgi:hypothetical protein
MKIQTITYKLVKNLGNYQSATLEATALVEDGGLPDIAAKELMDFVRCQLYPPDTSEKQQDGNDIF